MARNPPKQDSRRAQDKNGTSVLHPLFGSYCATADFLTPAQPGHGRRRVRYEAYLDNPAGKTWAVNKIVHHEPDVYSGRQEPHVVSVGVAQNINFTQALRLLAEFENGAQRKTDYYTQILAEDSAQGFRHFRAFAEREGYVFDTKSVPHPRPSRHALPPDQAFAAEDLARANRLLQRPEGEFNNDGPASRLPNTHFLFDHFNRFAPPASGLDAQMAELRIIHVFDKFANHIRQAHDKMADYCASYRNLGMGGMIAAAEDSLQQAQHSLRQLGAYGVDVRDFETFTLQCRISCAVLHAQGLFDLMNNNAGDFEQNETQFRARVEQSLQMLRRIDASDDARHALQNMIIQPRGPVVPAAISAFIQNYDRQRAAFSRHKTNTPRP